MIPEHTCPLCAGVFAAFFTLRDLINHIEIVHNSQAGDD